jgi:hypothetical protein
VQREKTEQAVKGEVCLHGAGGRGQLKLTPISLPIA